MDDIADGQTFEVPYPFIIEEVELCDGGGFYTEKSWRPGVRYEAIGPEDSEAIADGIGKQLITVVSQHKPGNFPKRYFYLRQWQAPSGKVFGKRRLLVASAGGFRSLIRGYRYPYRTQPQPPAT